MKKFCLLNLSLLIVIALFGFTKPKEKISILISEQSSKTEQLAAKELRRYIYLCTGIVPEIIQSNSLSVKQGSSIILSTKNSKLLKQSGDDAFFTDATKLESQQYIIKTVSRSKTQEARQKNSIIGECCFIIGGDEIGALYGAYRFLEYNGIRFYIHGDVVPDVKNDILFQEQAIVGKPLFALRGILPFHDFPQGPDWWNTDDYKAIIAQLPKMGLNFIGFHNYLADKGDVWKTSEPLVWIGTKDQINPDGTVKYAYPVSHANTSLNAWGRVNKKTSDFSFGASQMFEEDYYGAEYTMNISPWTHTDAENISMFNKVGEKLKSSFTLAHNLGVKTCIGTEIPLDIPEKVRDRLKAQGRDVESDAVKIELYEGMFLRIMKAYPLDYYWFWTNENWTWEGEKPGEVKKNEKDIQDAIQAKNNIKALFTFATCGWVLGPSRDRTEFDKIFPKDIPFSCINREVGFTPIDKGFKALKDRPKWAIPWMEDDPALSIPQLWVGRTRRDALDAYNYGCTGFMGIHWRTEPLGPVISALAKVTWDMNDWKDKPDTLKRDMPVDDFYKDWTEAQFGKEVVTEIAPIFISIDGGPLYKPVKNGTRVANLYRSCDWISGPGGLKPNRTPWEEVKMHFTYINKLAKLKDKVKGAGNRERFNYWYNFLSYNRTMAQIGCILGQIDTLMGKVKVEKNEDVKRKIVEEKVLPLKNEASNKWGEMVTQFLQCVNTPGEMGTIANLEQNSLSNLKVLTKYDSTLSVIAGKAVNTLLPKDYKGPSRLIVPTKRTLLETNENLNIKAIVLSQKPAISVIVYWRMIGDKDYKQVALNHIARGVYKGTIEKNNISGNDFEYYIEAKTDDATLLYPVTAPDQNQTVVIY